MSASTRWILRLVRYGLCLAAVAFLIHSVRWYDYVKLARPGQPRARLIETRDDGFVVLLDGRSVTLPPEAIHVVEVKGRRVPDIEYGIRSVVSQADRAKALWAVLIFAPVPILAAWRLTWMLRIQQVRLSLWNAVKLTFAGNFFNFALPGMTGGDLIKAYYITRFTHRKTEAVTTIFFDRVVGLMGFVLMAGAMILLTQNPADFAELGLPLALIVGGLALAAVVVFSRRIRRALRLRQLVERLPMAPQLLRVGEATIAMRRGKLIVFSALLLTFVLQTTVILSAIVMARALHMQGSFAHFFIYVAIGFLIAAVPITPPQAIGVMEFFYVWFFTADGLNSASQAFALAVAVRLIQLVWSLPGVLVPLLGAHLPDREDLTRLEHLEAVPDATRPEPPSAGNLAKP